MVLNEVCYFRLETKILEKAKDAADDQGISFSEYVRNLVLNDLKQKDALKKTLIEEGGTVVE